MKTRKRKEGERAWISAQKPDLMHVWTLVDRTRSTAVSRTSRSWWRAGPSGSRTSRTCSSSRSRSSSTTWRPAGTTCTCSGRSASACSSRRSITRYWQQSLTTGAALGGGGGGGGIGFGLPRLGNLINLIHTFDFLYERTHSRSRNTYNISKAFPVI